MKTKNVFPIMIFCFVFGVVACFGQDQNYIDSLTSKIKTSTPLDKQKLYTDLMYTYFYHDLVIARSYLDSIGLVSNEYSDDLRLKANYNNSTGGYYGMTSHYDTAMVYFKLALKDYEELNDQERISALLNNIGICQKREGDFESALATNLEALKLKEKLGVTGDDLGASFWNLGILYSELLDFNESNIWYDKAIKIYQDLEMESEMHILSSLKGQNYMELDSIDLAETIFLRSADYFKINNQPNEVCNALMDLGRIYLMKEDYKKAERNLEEAYVLSLNSEEAAMPGYAAGQLAKLYLETNRLKKAEQYILISMENSFELSLSKKLINDYQMLANIYEKQGRYKLALDKFKQYHIQQDSIFGIEKLKAMDELAIKYESEKKQAEIELLEEKDRMSRLEKKGLMASIISLLLILGSAIYALRQRLLKNKLAKEKVAQSLEFSEKQLASKKQELTAFALQLAHKNKVLEDLRMNVESLKSGKSKEVQRIVNSIEINKNDDESWDQFKRRFAAVHKDFESQIHKQYPNITAKEMRLMSLIKMNLSNKEMANILNISNEGIKKARYRLRKKLDLQTEDSLEQTIINI